MYFFWKQSPLLINYLIDELKQKVKEKQPKKRVHLIMLVEKISVQCIIVYYIHTHTHTYIYIYIYIIFACLELLIIIPIISFSVPSLTTLLVLVSLWLYE